MSRRKIKYLAALFSILSAILICGASPVTAQETVAGIHIVNPGEDLEVKRKELNLSYYLDPWPHDAAKGKSADVFLIIPEVDDLLLEIFDLEIAEDSSLHLGKRQNAMTAPSTGSAFILRHTVSEGIPNLAICFTGEERLKKCWVPRYSGQDNSLILDPGFFPRRTKAKNEQKKLYTQGTDPMLTGPELIDQPLFMVRRLWDEEQLTTLAKNFNIVPKGAFKNDQPYNLIFLPLVYPGRMNLHILEYQGGDGLLADQLEEFILNDNEAAVVALNFKALGEEKGYAVCTFNEQDEMFMWLPAIDEETGLLDGYGLGPRDKFIHWPDDE